MSHSPNFEAFTNLAKDHDLVPVYRRMLSDGLTPVSAFQKLDDGKDACLFESVIGGEKVGRHSTLEGLSPLLRRAASCVGQVLGRALERVA